MAASSPIATTRLCSFANPAEFETKPAMTAAEKAIVIGDLKTRRDVKLCDSCYRDLPDSCADLLSLELTTNRSSCSACAITDSRPEAFTEPFCTFLKENPTIFHTVDYLKTKMTSLGYKEVGAP